METPKKRLSKYWCSVPHCQCDIRNIYIKADHFHLKLTTANKERNINLILYAHIFQGYLKKGIY